MEKSKRSEIQAALLKLEGAPFPVGIRALQIEGKNVSMLQSEVLGALHAIVETEGQIGTRVRNNFETNIQILKVVVSELEGAAAEYFEQILAVARIGQSAIRPLDI